MVARMWLSSAFLAGLSSLIAAPAAAKLDVVVTFKPIHSLVAQVMEGVGTPTVLIDGAQSPHSFSLKPSGAKALSSADVFIRVSPSIETFTNKLVTSLPKSVEVITLADTPGMKLLDKREGATFETHEHVHEHKDQDHDGDHDDHEDGLIDGHVWLDTDNAKRIVMRVVEVLSKRSPEDAERLGANAAKLLTKIDMLAAEIEAAAKPLKDRPFVVFHDAYQYFEKRFGLTAVGSITVNPDRPPSAKRLTAIRQKIATLGATCVFAEPNVQPKVVSTVIENSKARAGTLDPEGTVIPAGVDHYATLLRRLSAGLKDCLEASS